MPTYIVPVDFSKTSESALDHAIKLTRENGGKLVLLHALSSAPMAMAGPYEGTPDMLIEYEKAEREEAERQMNKLIRKKKLKPGSFRSVILRRGDPAQAIANEAKKARASMIIMGSHGRTGLKRLVLGSVAERTLRYAHCPVLIVKK
ncbi:MAG TPA: universal stress protein [Candidatus Eisenbacteria bacterium]|nr:universal stress protein [Candidatus Eisenbacteria bacterium]